MKKFICILIFLVHTFSGYSDAIFLLGEKDHSGIHIEIQKSDGSIVDTTTTNASGHFYIRYQDRNTYYKLIATKEGYTPVVIDSVLAYQNQIYFISDNDPVLRPVKGVKILKNFIDEDLSDTTVIHVVENQCIISKDVTVGAGVKISFMNRASFYAEGNSKLVFAGTHNDSVKCIAYPGNINAIGAIDLTENVSALFSFCSFPRFFNIQLKDKQTKASLKNCNIQYLDFLSQGTAEIAYNSIETLKINQHNVFKNNDDNLPEIKIEGNKIAQLKSDFIEGPIFIKDNKVTGFIEMDTVLSRLILESNIMERCSLYYLNGLDLRCNIVRSTFLVSSHSTEGDILITDNSFAFSYWGDIIIRNDLANIEMRNNYFSIKSGQLKIIPGQYEPTRTRKVLLEDNTFSCKVVILNKTEYSTNVDLFRNVFGGDLMTVEIALGYHDNLFGKVMCFCGASAPNFTNILGYKTDNSNNIYSENISFINDTLPFLKESVEGFERRLGLKLEGSCLYEYYKDSYKYSDYHSISGRISSEFADSALAYVAAINKKDGKTSIQKTNRDGTYSIKGLKKGEYILYAIPRDSGYFINDRYVFTTFQTDYFPTYFLNKLDFQKANKLILTGDITEANITLIKKAHIENANLIAEGTILYKDTTLSDAGTDWMGPSIGNEPYIGIQYGCQSLIVFAEDENGTVVDWALTSSSGDFIFGNLPSGKFKIKAKRFGFHLEDEESFIIEPGMSGVIGYLVKDDVSSTSAILPTENANSHAVIPNPFYDKFILDGISKGEEVNVYDMMGKVIFNQVEHAAEPILIDGSSWPAGIYFVKTGDEINKIIKE